MPRAVAILALLVSAVASQEVLIDEPFDDAEPPDIVIANRGAGSCGGFVSPGQNAACIDDPAGVNGGPGTGRLHLTTGAPRLTGHAWFDRLLPLSTDRITVEFDVYISGGSNPPSDGLSCVFQLGTDTGASGTPGAGLMTGGFPAKYISVAIDLWDNGDLDPESPCDSSLGTCHIEVNQDGDPGEDPSVLTSIDVPDFAAAGGSGVPVHLRITLDGREIAVEVSTSHGDYGTRTAIHGLLPAAPDQDGIIGFAASTEAGNAVQSIDNVIVTRSLSTPPLVSWEAPVAEGGINCGGGPLSAILEGDPIEISGDSPYGDVVSIESGVLTAFTLRSSGRLPRGDDHSASYPGPIANLPHATLEDLYRTEAWSRTAIAYRHHVLPGRYEVTLHVAENCPCGISRSGEALRRYDVHVQGTPALLHFSPGIAGGQAIGSCEAVTGTAATRTFTVDALPLQGAIHYLEVEVADLGGGSPPENAQLNGITFRRIGSATGEPLDGDLEDARPPADAVFGPLVEVLALDFEHPDGTPAEEALAGVATVNPGRFFNPVIVGGRLRIASGEKIASATSVLFDGLDLDPQAVRIHAEFQVFIASTDEDPPADGLLFGIISGSNASRVGSPGGGLGFAGLDTAGMGVEVDLWEGGGFGDDSGYNTDGMAHVAVVGSGQGLATVDHVQDQNDYDPSLDGPDHWVDWLSPSGVHVEVLYEPAARIEVHVEALDGSFARRKVLDTFVTPFAAHEALVGFFAATGGEAATMEIDELRLAVARCSDGPEVAVISGDSFVETSLGTDGTALVDLDGSGSSAGDPGQALAFEWTLSGPFAGGVIAAPCDGTTSITFTEPGTYEAALEVDDGRCEIGESARATVTIRVRDMEGAQFIRGDTNCDGTLDISDAINTLNVLFLGTGLICCEDAADTNDDGTADISDPVASLNYLFLGAIPPADPFPLCGPDPTPDGEGCASPPACE